MEIKVLGTGCAKCRRLLSVTEEALAASGVKATLEKVERLGEIMTYEVTVMPALVIAGEVKVSGRIPKSDEVVAWIAAAAEAASA